jgi:hypothetical protein
MKDEVKAFKDKKHTFHPSSLDKEKPAALSPSQRVSLDGRSLT